MSNPHGLAELSHFGSMQRVGGKAAGFINKKFFHPSSLRNQEKLWQAQSADERNQKKQKELAQRREEELQVESLRKQMYLSGQGKASDLKTTGAAAEAALRQDGGSKGEQWEAAAEQKRRRQLLQKAANEEDEDDHLLDAATGERKLAKSKYPEDTWINGHSSVWGSWYCVDDKRWGFACCRRLDHGGECPLEPEEPAEEDRAKPSGRGRKRRKGGDDAAGDAAEGGGAGAGGGDGAEAAAETSAEARRTSAPLLDPKFVEAAARRKEKKRLEEEQRKKAKVADSGYLGDLLQDASAKKEDAPGLPSEEGTAAEHQEDK